MMNLIPWKHPRGYDLSARGFHPLDELRREARALFDRLVGGRSAQGPMPSGMLDVDTRDTEMVVKAALPGWEVNDFDVTLHDEVLTIRADRRWTGEEGNRYSHYEETLRVPHGINPDRVQASYRNGILELHLPLPEEAKGRRIPIRRQEPSAGLEASVPPLGL